MKRITSLLFITVLFLAGTAWADSKTLTVTGTFNGANCMYFNKDCPHDMSEGHKATEPDFVLTEPNGKYYYVVNIDRETKLKFFHNTVRITGKLKDKNTLFASTVEIKKDDKFQNVWTWEEVKKMLDKMNMH
jgi:hypothetical protein